MTASDSSDDTYIFSYPRFFVFFTFREGGDIRPILMILKILL